MSKYFVLVLLLFVGCKEEKSNPTESSSPTAVYLEYQNGFVADSVVAKVNNENIGPLYCNTDISIGHAANMHSHLTKGTYNLQIEIKNEGVIFDTVFSIEKQSLYIGVNYDRTSKAIHLIYSNEQFVYK